MSKSKSTRARTPEGVLKREVDNYLQELADQGKLILLRLNAGDFLDVRGGYRRRVKGCPKGTADMLVVYDSRIVFLELKGPTGRQTPEQKAFEQTAKERECEYHVVRSLDQVKEVIE